MTASDPSSRPLRRPVLAVLAATLLLAALPSAAERVALTFDDLPVNGALAPGTTEDSIARETIAVLKARHVPAVYGFVNGARLEDHPAGAEALRLWVAAGFDLANHTYGHHDLGEVSVERFVEDIRQNEPLLDLLQPPARTRWFRYPYLREGDTLAKRDEVRAALAARGYRIAQVTLDYEDYLWNSAYARCVARPDPATVAWLHRSYRELAAGYLDAGRAAARELVGRPIDHVLLLHLGAYSATILPELLDLLERKGFTLATLEEVSRDPIYALNPNLASRDGGTLLEQLLEARHQKFPAAPAKPYAALERACAPPPAS
jgi:peptidoglycan/xylan/chitin deacetylase (PgdA/CDA1 family)